MANDVAQQLYDKVVELLQAAAFDTNNMVADSDPDDPNSTRIYKNIHAMTGKGGSAGTNTWIGVSLGNTLYDDNTAGVYLGTTTVRIHMQRRVKDPETIVEELGEVEKKVRDTLHDAGENLGFTGTDTRYCQRWNAVGVLREPEELDVARNTSVREWVYVFEAKQTDPQT
jgi:hypothetical protein